MEAIGLNGKEFKVEELTDFALPEADENKRFRLMEVKPDKIVVRETFADGTTKMHEFPKNHNLTQLIPEISTFPKKSLSKWSDSLQKFPLTMQKIYRIAQVRLQYL